MKLFIASILVFALVILFLFALFPSDISVSRVIQINRPKDEVLRKIDDLREWKSWNLLLQNPPPADTANTRSNKSDRAYIRIGGLSVEIVKSGRDTIVTRWEQGNKFFTGSYNLTGLNGQTTVEWILRFKIHWYPWEKLASMFYDKQLGPVMEKSLLNLRSELENGAGPVP